MDGLLDLVESEAVSRHRRSIDAAAFDQAEEPLHALGAAGTQARPDRLVSHADAPLGARYGDRATFEQSTTMSAPRRFAISCRFATRSTATTRPAPSSRAPAVAIMPTGPAGARTARRGAARRRGEALEMARRARTRRD